jgi:hypothetical protein
MTTTFIFIVIIAAGAIIAVQGIQIILKRINPKANFFETILLSALEVKDKDKIIQIIGRMRVVYGLFFVTLGIWALI